MLKLIKMDIYRMFKSKYTYIVLTSAVFMMLASVFMTQQDVIYYQQDPSALERLYETGYEVNWGIYMGQVDPEWCSGKAIPLPELVAMNIQSKMLLMFQVAFVALFAGSEMRTGFIKNIAGHAHKRWELVIGKLATIAVFTAMLLSSALMATMLGSAIFFGYVHFDETMGFIRMMAVQYMLHAAYGSVVLLIVYALRSVVASMLTGILMAAGILQVVDAALVNVIPRLKYIDGFSIMSYLSSGNVGLISMTSGSALCMKALIVSVITLAVAGGVSGIIMQQRDL